MQKHRSQTLSRRGFTLVWVSILLTVAALMFVSMLPGQEAGDVNQKELLTIKKLEYVENAMRAFMAFKGRRPCPADGSAAENTSSFGAEAGTPGTCTVTSGMMGPDAGTNHVVGGIIPTRTLNIPDDYAFDAWGRRFTYVVDTRATLTSSCTTLMNFPTNNGIGGIQIENTTGVGGALLANVMYAYISHGPSGHGAFPPQGSAVTGRLNTGNTDADENNNAGASSDGNMTYSTSNFKNYFVQKDKTSTFDHIVWYRNDLKNTCCLGGVCVPTGFRFIGTTNYMGMTGLASPGAIITCDITNSGIPALVVANQINVWPDQTYVSVLFGHAGTFSSPIDPSQLNGTNGFLISDFTNGTWAENTVVMACGDINGDGYPDLVIAVGQGTANGIYVVFGGPKPWPSQVDVSKLNGSTGVNGTAGFYVPTANGWSNDYYESVTTGNITGHSGTTTDLIIGDPAVNYTPSSHNYLHSQVDVIVGGTGAWPATVNISSLAGYNPGSPGANGTNGFVAKTSTYTGATYLGYQVVTGDLNADGVADLVIARDDTGGDNYSALYVLFGKSGYTWPAIINLDSLTHSSTPAGTKILNVGADYWNGLTIDFADVNNDGYPDMLIGEPYAEYDFTHVGTIIYGQTGTWPDTVDLFTPLTNLTSPKGTTLRIPGRSGFNTWDIQMLHVGDVNKDGIQDLVVGTYDLNNNGSVYVLFGASSLSTAATFDLSTLNGTNGVRIDGASSGDQAGLNVWGGDINSDGYSDLMIGAPNSAPGGVSGAGTAYVVFGHGGTWTTPYSLSNIP